LIDRKERQLLDKAREKEKTQDLERQKKKTTSSGLVVGCRKDEKEDIDSHRNNSIIGGH